MELPRRKWLRLSALGVVGAAGCTSERNSDPMVAGSHETPTPDPEGTPGAATGESGATGEEQPTEHPLPEPEDRCTADPTVDVDDPLAVDVDAREIRRCAGRPFDTFETLDDWEARSGSLAPDEEAAFSGSQSARVEAAAGNGRAWISREFPGGVDLSGMDLSLALRLDSPATQGVVVRLDAPNPQNALHLGRYVFGAGWMRIDLGPIRERGSPDLSRVTRVNVIAGVGDADVAFNVDSLRLQPRAETGRAVVTFDHGYSSLYDVVFPIMEDHGHAGVVGVSPGSTEWHRNMSADQLRELQAAGWDVASRPRVSGNFRTVGDEATVSHLREAKQWLLDNDLERGADVLVWPAGRYDEASLRAASRYHHVGFAGGRTSVGTPTDPLVVPRVEGRELEDVRRVVDLAAKYDQLVVLKYGAIGNMLDGISDVRFENALSYAEQRGLEVLTATELWESLAG